ncbi:MAG TPA: RNA polymerase sigma factor [Hyphomonadaceae bacterium]|jgi:RNA polymerase sigma-70 factor (ECF subfamily)|nr:RNA polymerase sigma factor [Hyphomonadaceae bacterium]
MEEEDAALLASISQGSERAFNRLIDRYQQAVRNFLRGVAGPNDADDIAQETFLAVWTSARSYRGGASVKSWLFSIAWRKAKGAQRGWFRRAQRDAGWQEASELEQKRETPPAERLALRQALGELSLDQRAAVMLCLAHGFSHAEASEALDMPLGTIKSHVARGRDKLREVLGDEHND